MQVYFLIFINLSNGLGPDQMPRVTKESKQGSGGVGKYVPFQEVSRKPTGDVHDRVDNAREADEAEMLAADLSEDIVMEMVEAWVAETSRNQNQGVGGGLIHSPWNLVVNNVTGGQELKEGCRTMRRRMEDHKQWRNTLAKKVGGEGTNTNDGGKVYTTLTIGAWGTIRGVCREDDRHATATNGMGPYVGHAGAARGDD